MKKIRILAIIPNRNDATSFYRSIGPLTELTRRDGLNIEIAEPSSVSWSVIAANCDILFMQRPYNDDHVTMVKLAKIQGKPIWVDYDDDLFSVPESNPSHAVYGRDDIRRNIATIIASADHVTVSTETLKNAIQGMPTGPLAKKCTVIRNALPMHIIPPAPELPDTRNNLICWRGSATHIEDVEIWMEDILRATNSYKDYTFHFQGEVPWKLKKYATKNMVFSKSIDILEYFELLGNIQPRAMIVPLVDCPFNRAKSDIAFLEGVWAGAMCIAPDMPEWKNMATFNYGTMGGSLMRALNDVIQMGDKYLNERVSLSRQHDMRRVEAANNERERIIRELAGS